MLRPPSTDFSHPKMNLGVFYAQSSRSIGSPSIFTDQSYTEQSSPASMSFSDISQELFGDNMDSSNHEGPEDVSGVMTEVLVRMDRIVEHLRSKGELHAANCIAKDIISIITSFNDVTAPWDIQTSVLRPVAPPVPTNTPNSNVARSVAAYSPPVSSASTWAAVAAVEPAPNNRLVKFTPNDGIQTKYAEPAPGTDIAESDQRVVWIRGWKEQEPLSEITGKVGHGPVYSMAYSPKDNSVCIIFMCGSAAQALIDDDQDYVRRTGVSRFGPGRDVIVGLPYPTNADIKLMLNPANERRRLTFARQQLFTNGMTEDKFKGDIHAIVGPANVELIWLFNTGNATVVFSAVPLARMVRDEFRRLSRVKGSPYHNVVVTFSHDPCERPMSLITQMPAGHSQRSMGLYGGASAVPTTLPARGVTMNRRNTNNRAAVDANGWQTVTSRKR